MASTSPLLSFPVHGPSPFTPTPTPDPPFSPTTLQLGRSSWMRAISFAGYAGSNCFGATECQLGEGLPSEYPHPQVNRRAETCVTPVIGRSPPLLAAHPSPGSQSASLIPSLGAKSLASWRVYLSWGRTKGKEERAEGEWATEASNF